MSYKDWEGVFPETPPCFHEAVERALSERTPGWTERRITVKRKFPIMLAAAVAALCVTAAAAYVIQWNGALAQRFGADQAQQEKLTSSGAVGTPDQTVTENGVTVSALQTLGDKTGVYLLLCVKTPEGVALSDNSAFEGTQVNIEGSKDGVSWSGGFMSDSAEIASSSGKSNERYYELHLLNSQQADWNGKTITLNFKNLQEDRGKLDLYTVLEGDWSLSWTLSYTDQMRTFQLNKSYTVGGHAVTVKSVQLSPLSMTLSLGGDGLKALIGDSDLDQCGTLCTAALTLRDGTTIDDIGGEGGSDGYTDASYTSVTRFGTVRDTDQVAALILTFPWESGNNTLTIPLD